MPRYEFECDHCRKSFELTMTIAERSDAKVRCPGCGSEQVTPQMAVFNAKTSRKS